MSLKQYITLANNQTFDLSIIGVPHQYHNKIPSIGGFPKNFNPDARHVWLAILASEGYKEKVNGMPAGERWTLIIQLFIKWCNDQAISPFDNHLDRTDNSRILSFLELQRRKLVKYIDEIGILKVVTIKSPYRVYMRRDTGFVIQSYCDFSNFGGFDQLQKFLTHPKVGFTKVGLAWQKVLDSTTRIHVKTVNSNRAIVWYEIRVGSPVYFPGSERKTPTIRQVDNFIDNTIWLPIVRSHRFKTLNKRSLF